MEKSVFGASLVMTGLVNGLTSGGLVLTGTLILAGAAVILVKRKGADKDGITIN